MVNVYEAGSAPPATLYHPLMRALVPSDASELVMAVQPAGGVSVRLAPPWLAVMASSRSPACVPAGLFIVMLVAPWMADADVDERTCGVSVACGGAGWQFCVPESVNVCPASGMNCQS